MAEDNRGVAVVAWIAVAVFAITVIIGLLRPSPSPELPTRPGSKASATPSSPRAPSPRIESGVALLPGETLVSSPEPAPAPPPATPAPKPRPAPRPPKYLKAKPKAPPQHVREDTQSRETQRAECTNCGRVIGMRQGDYEWEVRVRFDDGSRQTRRFRYRPAVEIDDVVRLDDGVLRRSSRPALGLRR